MRRKNKGRLERETGSMQPIMLEMCGKRVSSLYHFTAGCETASVFYTGNPKNGSPVLVRDDASSKLQRKMCH